MRRINPPDYIRWKIQYACTMTWNLSLSFLINMELVVILNSFNYKIYMNYKLVLKNCSVRVR